MIMDTLGALALATKPPTDELMERQPFRRKGNIITNVMWRNIMGQSLYQTIKPSKQIVEFIAILLKTCKRVKVPSFIVNLISRRWPLPEEMHCGLEILVM
ncbi:putative cation-transporting P-type ATPase, P-type ATPase, transmembrane domain superfamily [Helianthus annuus]|nr:putative cation-transporting P-type ATPase, P-type ATPase, transmembrane domain superfamily [Helianthus annuus]KAJ0433728.1 putative cation-transporting P-type ATPase, P-type ATPase, transmembrane domain superfamily [Helianthus annuus]KAJ0447702.1 putative cation-transporting P-type ATPase, P-type ATPase, transmembrane domain superfamily [Helianthus annuus]KAJ0632603.1 putative cation-transporting P-type ATPase, P-type ATPase, transmembrane domain superfamily [Helianthus annuus]